ncbi:MAG: 2-oxoglutarate dehydrogenase E1 component, partial [Acidobacteriota bacterium]
MPVIDDPHVRERADSVRRILLCSGKIYVDLISSNFRKENLPIAVVRLEQLYPFPNEQFDQILQSYPRLEEVVWIQEEPENMGAWSFVRPRLEELLGERRILRYIGRNRNASPAEGSAARHGLRQKKLIEKAFELAMIDALKV